MGTGHMLLKMCGSSIGFHEEETFKRPKRHSCELLVPRSLSPPKTQTDQEIEDPFFKFDSLTQLGK